MKNKLMSLYPGMPYGPAPSWCFPVFECGMYLLFLVCLVYAQKKGKRDVIYLLGGLAFGLLLEYIEVLSGSYTYGRFMVMVGRAPLDIPLCIGVGWGIIIYSSRLFTDGLGLSLWACAALDTLLALNIDLSMDTVAYRLHMWHWHWEGTPYNPLTANWFGVPYGNFCGWQMVIFFYSAFSRIFERVLLNRISPPLYKFILVALLALICSQVFLYVIETYVDDILFKTLGIRSIHRFLGTSVILVLITARGFIKKKAPSKDVSLLTWLVPGWFHVFFFACLFIFGFYVENTWMTVASCASFAIGIIVHITPLSSAISSDETNL